MPREQLITFTPKDLERFWRKVNKSDGCWTWTAALTHGYGQFSVTLSHGVYKNVGAHRISYMISVGPIPARAFILHSCDNPPCVNPRHLRPGTPLDNMQDKLTKGRANMPNGERHVKSKLTAVQVLRIRLLRASGISVSKLADANDVSNGCIYAVVNRATWKHI
ncbi:hypothetical protein LCGC14_0437050 [marine sediment metagenome]|uniref:HNH nuclease domain-containing protein n=1 Tax=marine sediment metagenome TaxID=412755 RepID=A0A0F9V8L5_9ZZZZ